MNQFLNIKNFNYNYKFKGLTFSAFYKEIQSNRNSLLLQLLGQLSEVQRVLDLKEDVRQVVDGCLVRVECGVVLYEEDQDGDEGEEDQVDGVKLLALLRPEVDLVAAHLHGVVGHQGGGLAGLALVGGGGHHVLNSFVLLLLGKFLNVEIEERSMDQFRSWGGLGWADLSHDPVRYSSGGVRSISYNLLSWRHLLLKD